MDQEAPKEMMEGLVTTKLAYLIQKVKAAFMAVEEVEVEIPFMPEVEQVL